MGASEWTGYSTATPGSTYAYTTPGNYGYEGSTTIEHHSNFHLPTGNFLYKIKIIETFEKPTSFLFGLFFF